MAGSAQHGTNNYWPGFVDALANMIMAMIFMVLIFMILILHYKVNTSKATQAQEQVQQKTPATPTVATSPTTVKEQSASEVKVKSTESATAVKTQDSVSELKAEIVRLSEELQTSQEQLQASQEQRQLADALLRTQAPVSAMQSVTGVAGDPVVVEADHGNYFGAKSSPGDKPPTISGDENLWRVVYSNQGYELDPQAKEKLTTLLNPLKSRQGMRIKLIAPAALGVGYSDARRRSYYRALGVRNTLITAGWSPTVIDIEIADRNETAGQAQEVLIQPMMQTGSGNGTP